MKIKVLVLAFVLLIALSVGCAPQPAPAPTPTTPPTTTPEPTTPTPPTTPEVVTTASIVNDEAAFEKAISKEGTWIIAPLKDLTFTKDLVLEGDFHDKNDPAKDLKRKIALYTQDENRNVTGTFTLTAPKLTIKSPNAGLWYGTFKGDIYVSAPNFTLYSAKVDGNVYFTTDEAKSTFKKDETKGACTITGKEELKK